MITEDLIAYIQAQLRKDISKDIIVSKLSSAGWHRDDIDEAFRKILPPPIITKKIEDKKIISEKPLQGPITVNQTVNTRRENDPYHEKIGAGEPEAMSAQVFTPVKSEQNKPVGNIAIPQQPAISQNQPKPIFAKSFSEANPKPVFSPSNKVVNTPKIDTTKNQVEIYNQELMPTLKPKGQPEPEVIKKATPPPNVNTSASINFVPKEIPIMRKIEPVVEPQVANPVPIKPQVTEEVKQNQAFSSTISGMRITPNIAKSDVPESRGVPSGAMLHSYQKALISANVVNDQLFHKKRSALVKWLVGILVVSAIGGSAFAYYENYFSLPKFNFSLIKKDPKTLLIESPIVLNELKAYKIDTTAKISLPPLADITSGLVSGEAISTTDTDYISMSSTGLVNHNDIISTVFDYKARFNSSFFTKDIITSLKYSNSISLVSIPDLTELLGEYSPKPSDVLVTNGQFDVFFNLLPSSIRDYVNKIDIDKLFAVGVPSYINDESSSIFKEFVNSANVLEREPEEIKGVLSYHYSLNTDKSSSKKFITTFVNMFTTGMSDSDKEVLADRLGAVSFDSLDVWIGEKDSKIHQYSFKLSSPLSRLIGLEDKGIAGNTVTLDWKTIYYDFDIYNQISMPNNAKNTSDFAKEINDTNIKEKVSSFKSLADVFHNATGNFGKRSNQTGSCTNPNPSSVFSPVGHPKGASNAVGNIASTMNDLLSTTGGALSCYSSSNAWALSAPLSTDPSTSFCIDNTGSSKVLNMPITGPSCK